MWPRRLSLRTKIIAWSFVPTAIILVAVAMMNLYAYQRVTEDLVLERDRELTRLTAERLGRELVRYAELLSSVSVALADVMDDPQMLTVLFASESARLSVFDGGVLVLDDQGIVVASERGRQSAIGLDWGERAYFQRVSRSFLPVVSDIAADGPGGVEVVVVAVPVMGGQHTLRGVLVGMFRLRYWSGSGFHAGLTQGLVRIPRWSEGDVDVTGQAAQEGMVLDSLYRLLRRTGLIKSSVSGRAHAYLVDGDGRVLYHPDRQRIGDRVASQPVVQAVGLGAAGAERSRALDGEQIVASYAPVPGTAWGLIVEESWESLVAPSRSYARFLLALLALGVIVPALVVTVAVRRITYPIAQLIDASNQVAEGVLGQNLSISTHDELEDLAAQFNRMSQRLQASYTHLERRVAERTHELSTLNAVAAQVGRSLDLGDILTAALERTQAFVGMPVGAACCEVDGEYRWYAMVGVDASRAACWADALCDRLRGASKGRFDAPVILSSGDLYRLAGGGDAAWQALHTVIGIPLTAKSSLLGLLLVGSPEARVIGPDLVASLTSIGHQVGMAVDNARLYEQAQSLAVVAERQRLSRDLHDAVCQSLYVVNLYASTVARLLEAGRADEALARMEELQATAQTALQEMRLLIHDLRPSVLDTEGLVMALQERLDAVEGRVGLRTLLTVEGHGELPPKVEDGLYRIAQEAMNNSLKHANAREMRVSLRYDPDCVVLEIADDGIGFQVDGDGCRGGVGLDSMCTRAHEMGAELSIDSRRGQGTRVRVEVAR